MRDRDLAALRALAGRHAGLLATHLEDPTWEPVFKAASRYLAARSIQSRVVRAYPSKLHGRGTLGEDSGLVGAAVWGAGVAGPPDAAGERGFVGVRTTMGRLSFRRRFCYTKEGDAVVLARDHLAAIVAQAQEEAPLECCGLLLGRGRRVERVFPGTNIDRSPVTYNMDPQELFRAHREMEAQGTDLVAIYHSHPRTRAYPSSTDVGKATYPDAFYMIISLQDASLPEIRVFRIGGGDITEGTVSVA